MKKYSAIILAGPLVLICLGTAAQSQTQDQSKEELKLQLPKPMFIGTPQNIKTPNLEVVTGQAARPVLCPQGDQARLAQGAGDGERHAAGHRRVTFVTDGEKSGEDGYFVELGPGKQWVQIDLKGELP